MLDQLIELTKSNQFFQGTFFVGLIAGLAYYAKSSAFWVYNRIKRAVTYVVVIEEKSMLYNVINNYLYKHHRECFKNVEADMIIAADSDDKDEMQRWILNGKISRRKQFAKNRRKLNLTQNIDSFMLWIEGKPVFFNKSKTELKGANDIYAATRGSFEIRSMFGKNVIHRWIDGIVSDYNASIEENERISVYVHDAWNHGWMVHKEFKPITIDRVVLDEDVKSNLIDDISKWMDNKEFYTNLGLTHKRGYLLWGEPGNGKTSLVMAIAKEFDRDIYYMDVNSFASEEALRRAFSTIPEGSILLMEDIDQVWKGRNPVNPNCKITFSLFLNLLNGVLDKDDMLLFMTTNKLDELDEALIRPGRIDYRLEVTKPNLTLVEKYLSNYYEKNLKLLSYSKNYSYAQLLDLCKRHEDYNDVIKELC